MSLLEQLTTLPAREIRCATKLIDRGEVIVQSVRDEEIVAFVYERYQRFRVEMSCDGGRVERYWCGCGATAKKEPCRHVYAMALELQRVKPELAQPGIPAPTPAWRKQFKTLSGLPGPAPRESAAAPRRRELAYVIDLPACRTKRGLVIAVAEQRRAKDGTIRLRRRRGSTTQLADIADPADRQLLAMLRGCHSDSYGYGWNNEFPIEPAMFDALLPAMAGTGRLFAGNDADDRCVNAVGPLAWEGGPAWEFCLQTTKDDQRRAYVMKGTLHRNGRTLDVRQPLQILSAGLVVLSDSVARLDAGSSFNWIAELHKAGEIAVPFADAENMLRELLQMRSLPRLQMPEELQIEQCIGTPVPRLLIRASKDTETYRKKLRGELTFDYDVAKVPFGRASASDVLHLEGRRVVRRNPDAEQKLVARLFEAGFTEYNAYYDGTQLLLVQKKLPAAVRGLLADGWHVEAEGKLYRKAGHWSGLSVNSGIDFFEVSGAIDFEGKSVQLPTLLAAVRKGENTIVLDDGSMGMIPEEWLKKYALLASAGETDADHLRFARGQAVLLDALLAAEPNVQVDEIFAQTRAALRRFKGIAPQDPSTDFTGQLRPYQREALGWFEFLRSFGFGGCLADDMGLGKTVQVLALLDLRRRERAAAGQPGAPSLVVVPRSLVFNWLNEANKFTAQLKVLDNTSVQRDRSGESLAQYDLVLCTYGTLVRDVPHLKDVHFDYVVLDESQAVKNASTDSAKAVRLLKGQHKLALSGTPIQNHIGELWSLFEFLNPGLLGASSAFAGAIGRKPDPELRNVLARALRPFILRRTKEQVAPELPPRTEQTVYCELDAEQRKLYDELRNHYRVLLLGKADKELNNSKIEILEALLRLRQAAIHPGLIDKARAQSSSAKLEVLLERLSETIEEGHKTLIFSQFVSMLDIVRNRLNRQQIPYAYLDGQTHDRQAAVKQFQEDPECKLFLISLKAGGLGLNLTAAEYVFLLDPWWNPAVEAQAIDRAHRIGQTQHVFAYRIIAKDTVEEKVLQLQQSKRDLADAIINADNSLIRTLGRDDLELLLS
ncbi:MAG: DEAD/DEAH box helicase [Tepidisphaerales bacterium]